MEQDRKIFHFELLNQLRPFILRLYLNCQGSDRVRHRAEFGMKLKFYSEKR
jgi:hypothetical protein